MNPLGHPARMLSIAIPPRPTTTNRRSPEEKVKGRWEVADSAMEATCSFGSSSWWRYYVSRHVTALSPIPASRERNQLMKGRRMIGPEKARGAHRAVSLAVDGVALYATALHPCPSETRQTSTWGGGEAEPEADAMDSDPRVPEEKVLIWPSSRIYFPFPIHSRCALGARADANAITMCHTQHSLPPPEARKPRKTVDNRIASNRYNIAGLHSLAADLHRRRFCQKIK